MRTLFVAPILLLTLALVAPVAAAAGPERSRVVVEIPELLVASCDGFDIVATRGTIDRRMLNWRDEAGNDLLERRNVHFDIVFVNSASGLSASYTGQFAAEIDFVANTTSLTGNYRKLQIDGRTVLIASGYSFFDEEPGSSFVHGRSDLDAFWAGLCEAMA